MKSFTDNLGRAWLISVTVGSIKRVRALCGIDLASLVSLTPGKQPDTTVLERLATDPVLLVDVLYAICKPECDLKGISAEDFGCSMAGDAISLATDALLDDVIDFFPETKRRVLKRLVDAGRRFGELAEERLKRFLDDPETDAMLDSALAESTPSPTVSPGSAE